MNNSVQLTDCRHNQACRGAEVGWVVNDVGVTEGSEKNISRWFYDPKIWIYGVF